MFSLQWRPSRHEHKYRIHHRHDVYYRCMPRTQSNRTFVIFIDQKKPCEGSLKIKENIPGRWLLLIGNDLIG